jgi:tetratricopeptide (TPR) repeat protein
MKFRNLALSAVGVLLLALPSFAQTSSMEGEVKGPDGQPLRGALVKIERTDIRGNYKVKTDRRGRFFHAGLPLGNYRVILEVDGKDVDRVENVRTRLGDPSVVNFDLQAARQKQEALQKAAETGQLTQEQTRDMTPEQRAEVEKAMKQREEALKKNKALSDSFNEGMNAMQGKNFDVAVGAFEKAAELDPKQHVVWAQLAEAYVQQARAKTGGERDAAMEKGLATYIKAIELKPDDAAYYNNYALALVTANKVEEAQVQLTKAAQINPQGAGQYFYNLGAVLTNTGQSDAASEAFKRAIEADPNYAEAHYQYGVSLMSKAQIDADGKINPAPGTREALEKYVALRPDGPNAESAKGLLATFDAKLDTQYANPAAPPAKKGKKK